MEAMGKEQLWPIMAVVIGKTKVFNMGCSRKHHLKDGKNTQVSFFIKKKKTAARLQPFMLFPSKQVTDVVKG